MGWVLDILYSGMRYFGLCNDLDDYLCERWRFMSQPILFGY